MMLGGISEWIGDMYDDALDAAQWVGNQVTSKLAQWRADVARFNQALNDLQATPAADADGNATRSALLARGQDIKSKVDWVQSTLADVSGFFGLSGLGVLPLIVPAVIVAAIAAVTILIYKWTEEVTSYLKEERLVKSGVPRTQAQASTKAGGIFGDAAQLVWPVALLGGAYLFFNSRKERS